MSEKVIEIKQVSKRYGDKTVLNNVSFAVRKGTIHGFIGPNGAGKTTTLSILTRLVLPTYGEAYIESKSVNHDPRFNERLGFIPAEPKFPNLTVEKYLLDVGYLRDIPSEVVLRKLAGSPLSQFRSQNCHSLSTDPSFRQDLFNNLKNIRDKGGTILMSTHILSDLQKLADDITMIRRGRIVYTVPFVAYKALMKFATDQEQRTAEERRESEEESFQKAVGVFFGNEIDVPNITSGVKSKVKIMELLHLKNREDLRKEKKNREEGNSEGRGKEMGTMKKMGKQAFDSFNVVGFSFPFTANNVFFFQQTNGEPTFSGQDYTQGKTF
ncbi:10543_t:CDS:2 [Cetraspora pellucida]|uniref:10543_t:CDS:1 n=1 Tax=Cetraspora pellucida TaxID=1433469 RepID=A0ACA9LB96_9GLOM|nr:10543_t:CDS:2 [Cetraspora pellucida]